MFQVGHSSFLFALLAIHGHTYSVFVSDSAIDQFQIHRIPPYAAYPLTNNSMFGMVGIVHDRHHFRKTSWAAAIFHWGIADGLGAVRIRLGAVLDETV